MWVVCINSGPPQCVAKFAQSEYFNNKLLRSEIPSGMGAKLPTVAASNNRDHARNLSSRTLVIMFNRSHVDIGRASTPQSLFLLLARATYTMVLFFTHIPFVENHTINATPPEKLKQHPLLFTTNHTDRTFFLWRPEPGTTSTSWSQHHFVDVSLTL